MKQVLVAYMKKFTDLGEDAINAMVKDVVVEAFRKGTVLIAQGEIPKACYFVLEGIVRKYAVDEEGIETTYDFYTDQQSIVIFYESDIERESPYSIACVDDCVLAVGDLETQATAFQNHEALIPMTRMMIEENVDQLQETYATFLRKSPEEKVQLLIDERPLLLERVPQYQLASYLGIAPESFSRIKRRLERSHIKAVE